MWSFREKILSGSCDILIISSTQNHINGSNETHCFSISCGMYTLKCRPSVFFPSLVEGTHWNVDNWYFFFWKLGHLRTNCDKVNNCWSNLFYFPWGMQLAFRFWYSWKLCMNINQKHVKNRICYTFSLSNFHNEQYHYLQLETL